MNIKTLNHMDMKANRNENPTSGGVGVGVGVGLKKNKKHVPEMDATVSYCG